jgi:hypothetical protein
VRVRAPSLGGLGPGRRCRIAAGPGWTILTLDKLGLVIAFAWVTVLAYGVFRPQTWRRTGAADLQVLQATPSEPFPPAMGRP